MITRFSFRSLRTSSCSLGTWCYSFRAKDHSQPREGVWDKLQNSVTDSTKLFWTSQKSWSWLCENSRPGERDGSNSRRILFGPVVKPIIMNLCDYCLSLETRDIIFFLFFQILTYMNQKWRDYHFQWNKSEYANINQINVPPSKLWKPDIILYNR